MKHLNLLILIISCAILVVIGAPLREFRFDKDGNLEVKGAVFVQHPEGVSHVDYTANKNGYKPIWAYNKGDENIVTTRPITTSTIQSVGVGAPCLKSLCG